VALPVDQVVKDVLIVNDGHLLSASGRNIRLYRVLPVEENGIVVKRGCGSTGMSEAATAIAF
jgi:hypothetical protein